MNLYIHGVEIKQGYTREKDVSNQVYPLTYSIPPREGYTQSIIARSVMKYPTETWTI